MEKTSQKKINRELSSLWKEDSELSESVEYSFDMSEHKNLWVELVEECQNETLEIKLKNKPISSQDKYSEHKIWLTSDEEYANSLHGCIVPSNVYFILNNSYVLCIDFYNDWNSYFNIFLNRLHYSYALIIYLCILLSFKLSIYLLLFLFLRKFFNNLFFRKYNTLVFLRKIQRGPLLLQ